MWPVGFRRAKKFISNFDMGDEDGEISKQEWMNAWLHPVTTRAERGK